MRDTKSYLQPAFILFITGVFAALALVGIRAWLAKDTGSQEGRVPLATPLATDTDPGPKASETTPVDQPRIVVDVHPEKSERPVELQEPTRIAEEQVQDPQSPESEKNYFPYGRPTPDWVFEQKYAGLPPSEIQQAKETIQAEYNLASKIAFKERFDAGDYEVIPYGQSAGGIPGDDRIISGRSMPNSPDSQVVRLGVDQYPHVYELWYEYLWLATQR